MNSHDVWDSIKKKKAPKKQKIQTHNRRKNKSTERYPKVAEIMEFTGKDIKIAIKDMFHMFKKEEEYIIMKRDKRYKKVTNKTLRNEDLIISEMKNTLDGIHSRLNTIEEKISEFGGIETIHIKRERKRLKHQNNRTLTTCGIILSHLAYI